MQPCMRCRLREETADDYVCNFCRVERAGMLIAEFKFALSDILEIYTYMIDAGDEVNASMVFEESAKVLSEVKKRFFPFGDRFPIDVRQNALVA